MKVLHLGTAVMQDTRALCQDDQQIEAFSVEGFSDETSLSAPSRFCPRSWCPS